MPLPADEISLFDLDHVAWLKDQRDPLLWHVAAMSGLTYGDPYGFTAWVMEQPELDRATAGFVFLGRYGPDWLGGTPILGGDGLGGEELVAVFEAICRRSAIGFGQDELGLHPGFDPTRVACLDLIDLGRVTVEVPAPRSLVATPFPPAVPHGYAIEDGAIYEV